MTSIIDAFRRYGVEPMEPQNPIWSELDKMLNQREARNKYIPGSTPMIAVLTDWPEESINQLPYPERLGLDIDCAPVVIAHLQYSQLFHAAFDRSLLKMDNTVFEDPSALAALRTYYLSQADEGRHSWEGSVAILHAYNAWDDESEAKLMRHIQVYLSEAQAETDRIRAVRLMPYVTAPGDLLLSLTYADIAHTKYWVLNYSSNNNLPSRCRMEIIIGAGIIDEFIPYDALTSHIVSFCKVMTPVLDSYTIFLFCACKDIDQYGNVGSERNTRSLINTGFPECQIALQELWSKYPLDICQQLQHYYSVASALDTDVFAIANTMTQMISSGYEDYRDLDDTLALL